MATSVTLPALGESVTEGTVTQWLKQVGDSVAVDEPLLEISTDKVDTEIPSPVAGTLLEIKAAEDETVEVGAVLAIIGEDGESADEAPAAEAPVSEDNVQGEAPASSAQSNSASAADSAEPSSPAADPAEGSSPAADPVEAPAPAADPVEAPAPAAEPASAAEPAPAAAPEPAPAPEEPRSVSPEQSAEAEHDAAESAPAPAADTAPAAEGGTAVTLPALGESVTEGTVTQWLKQVGDDVALDEPLLEISTDKVDTEIPSPVAGKLLEIKVDEDETVEVGAELAIIGTNGTAPAASAPTQAAPAESAPAESAPAESAPAEAAPAEAAPAQAQAA